MNTFWKYLKRVVGTLVISIFLTGILFPLLSGLLISTSDVSNRTLRILELIFMIALAIAGWNILKKEEQIREQRKRNNNDPN